MAKNLVKLANGFDFTEADYNLLKKDVATMPAKKQLAYKELVAKVGDPTAAILAFETANPAGNAGNATGEKSYSDLKKKYNAGLKKALTEHGATLQKMLGKSTDTLIKRITSSSKAMLPLKDELVGLQTKLLIARKPEEKVAAQKSIDEKQAEINKLEVELKDATDRYQDAAGMLIVIEEGGDFMSEFVAISRKYMPVKNDETEKAFSEKGRFTLTKQGMEAVEESVYQSMMKGLNPLLGLKMELDNKGSERIAATEFLNPVDAKGVALAGKDLVDFYVSEYNSLKGIDQKVTNTVMAKLLEAVNAHMAAVNAARAIEDEALKSGIVSAIGTDLVIKAVKSGGTKAAAGEKIETKNVTMVFPDKTKFGRDVEWTDKGYITEAADFKKELIKYCEAHTTVVNYVPAVESSKKDNTYFKSTDNGKECYISGFEIKAGKYADRSVITAKGGGKYTNAFQEGIRHSTLDSAENCLAVVAEAFQVKGIQIQKDGVTVYTTK